ncbi:MAG: biopolymer transporter ExbD [Planctomycetota bacterium]|nr:biopolymer transporter ExbD [Planctomycetota bacterium]
MGTMRAGRYDDDDFSLPMTPLIDIVFNLLVFFLLATTIVEEESALHIVLPSGRHGEAADKEGGEIVLSVDRDGIVVYGGRAVGMEELREILAEAGARKPPPRVVLRGDRDAPYGHVAGVLDMCRGAGLTRISASLLAEPGGR